MIYLHSIFSLIIFAIGFLVYIKGGKEIFDIVIASLFITCGIVLLIFLLRLIRPIIKIGRSIKHTDNSLNFRINNETKNEANINELNIIAATKIEDGEPASTIKEYLINIKGADKFVAENIVKDHYNSRQKHFRILGFFFVNIGAIILIASFIFQEIMNDLMAEWNRWSAHQTGGMVHFIIIILWAISFFISVKGLMFLLFGGKGIKTKRPV